MRFLEAEREFKLSRDVMRFVPSRQRISYFTKRLMGSPVVNDDDAASASHRVPT